MLPQGKASSEQDPGAATGRGSERRTSEGPPPFLLTPATNAISRPAPYRNRPGARENARQPASTSSLLIARFPTELNVHYRDGIAASGKQP